MGSFTSPDRRDRRLLVSPPKDRDKQSLMLRARFLHLIANNDTCLVREANPGRRRQLPCTTHWLLATWSHGSLWEGRVFLVSWVKISFGRSVFSLFCTAAGVGRTQQQAGCRRMEKNPKAALFCLANRCSRSKITERWMYSVRQIETLWLANSAAAEAQKGLYLRSYLYRGYNKLILVSF